MGKPSPDDLLTTAEAAKVAGLAATTLREHAQRGHLPARKVGRDWIFRRGDVKAFKPRPRGKPRKELA